MKKHRSLVNMSFGMGLNSGGADLFIDQVQTNCSCSGLEKELQSGFARIDSLRLQSGESVKLAMRVSVRGAPVGSQLTNGVEFRTNDPNQPNARIQILIGPVLGGVNCDPKNVILGTVPVGSKASHVVSVFDDCVSPRKVERLVVVPEGIAEATFVPAERETKNNEKGRFLGKLNLRINTAKPDIVNAAVYIHLENNVRQPVHLPIYGKIAAPVEFFPATIYLPLMGSSGPKYDAICMIRSSVGRPLSISVDSVPPGLVVEMATVDGELGTNLKITYKAESQNTGEPGKRAIKIRAKINETEIPLEIPVFLNKERR